ncbi:MAG: hypothetical protein ACE5E6_03155 [Phycisphaerae bacterium]
MGCRRNVRLADEHIRHATVRVVEHYGIRLDRDATPKQVAYVLLRAVYDDFRADTPAERDAAMDVEFDVCAADELARTNTTSMTRDEFITMVVRLWTPTLAHYVGSFPRSWEEADRRLVVSPIARAPRKSEMVGVKMVAADPSGDPNADVVVVVWMVKDDRFWRVTHTGFDVGKRSIASAG